VWRNRVCDPNFKQPTEPGKSPFTFIAENPPMTPVSVSTIAWLHGVAL
jgi:hypothetical protein